MIGPGKYDPVLTEIREICDARVAVLCIIDGVLGSGFSVQCRSPDEAQHLPTMLRHMADEIEKDAPLTPH